MFVGAHRLIDVLNMSFHRVASIESWERPRGVSPAASERRKMSFNPVAVLVPPKPAQIEPVHPIEVSLVLRIGKWDADTRRRGG